MKIPLDAVIPAGKLTEYLLYSSTQSKAKIMKLPLYQEVVLNRDFPQYQLQRGDVAMLNDYVPHPDRGEEGCILEIYNESGEFLKVVTVPISSVEAVRHHLSKIA